MTLFAQLRTLARMSQTTPMSTRDVAQALRTSVPTITRRARAGDLPVLYKVPGSRGAYLFDREAVERLVRERAS